MARDDELSPREITALITQLEKRIDQLKQLYERYFIGVDRKPPMALHHQVVREVLELDQLYISNTALRFRAQSLNQRFTTYRTYWNRTLRQIEEGTYHRDRSRAERREQQRARQAEQTRHQDEAYELDLEADFIGDLADIDLEEIFSQPQPAPTPAPTAPRSDSERERIRLQRLAEIQAQLGLTPGPVAPTPAPQQPQPRQPQPQPRQAQQAQRPQSSMAQRPLSRQQKLAAMRERLNRLDSKPPATSPQPQQTPQSQPAPQPRQAPQRTSSGTTRAEKLQQLSRRLRQERSSAPQRTISRSQTSTTGPSPQISRSTTSQRIVQRPSNPGDHNGSK